MKIKKPYLGNHYKSYIQKKDFFKCWFIHGSTQEALFYNKNVFNFNIPYYGFLVESNYDFFNKIHKAQTQMRTHFHHLNHYKIYQC